MKFEFPDRDKLTDFDVNLINSLLSNQIKN
ncbi:hypothetical protein SAMN04489761_4333 [Tenacibaculum sp. MAR_2009_124]|nr:hypothetical protein SAMN04489761_4333 [Tenacibaculum sp. MAR_2009_124]